LASRDKVRDVAVDLGGFSNWRSSTPPDPLSTIRINEALHGPRPGLVYPFSGHEGERALRMILIAALAVASLQAPAPSQAAGKTVLTHETL
jgi:hypothetical protein